MLETRSIARSVIALALLAGCDDKAKQKQVAPSATALTDTKPKAAGAAELAIVEDSSAVEFMMEAPKEKIRGRVSSTTTGEIAVPLRDITQTTAHLYVDIGDLELFQTKAGDDGAFGEETKSETQNEHARNWLEIGDCEDVEDKAKCEKETKENRKVEFTISEVVTDQKDVTKLSGNTRTVKATVTGDFLLHQHKTQKTAELELTFAFDGDRVKSLKVKTVKPFEVGLAEHDVKPRETFGKLAQKTLDVLSPKVAKVAEVSVEFEATPKAGAAGAASAEPAADDESAN